jgi:hypothetical protein
MVSGVDLWDFSRTRGCVSRKFYAKAFLIWHGLELVHSGVEVGLQGVDCRVELLGEGSAIQWSQANHPGGFPLHEFLQDLEKMNLRGLAIEHQGTLPTSYYSELVNIPHRAGVVLWT